MIMLQDKSVCQVTIKHHLQGRGKLYFSNLLSNKCSVTFLHKLLFEEKLAFSFQCVWVGRNTPKTQQTLFFSHVLEQLNNVTNLPSTAHYLKQLDLID